MSSATKTSTSTQAAPRTEFKVTLGRGKAVSVGALRTLGANNITDALIEILTRHIGNEAWLSLSAFNGNHRSKKDWLSATAFGVDLDTGEKDKHIPLTKEQREAITAAFSTAPGSLAYITRCGVRLIFLLDEPATDAEAAVLASQGASALAGEWVSKLPFILEVDRKCVGDLARMFYMPNATVDGVKRSAEVIRLRVEPYTIEELATHAPPPPPKAPALSLVPCRVDSGDDDLKSAVANFNIANPVDWAQFGRECPFCGHKDCFDPLPESPQRWFCFSANHGTIGVQSSPLGRHGDALDYHAFIAKKDRIAHLRDSGFLADDERPEIQLTANEHEAVHEAVEALGGHPDLFQRAGRLVVVRHDALDDDEGDCSIITIRTPALRVRLSEAARFTKYNKKENEFLPCAPPKEIAEAVNSLGDWPGVRTLRGVVQHPVLRRDGSLLRTPGYDQASGLFYAPSGQVPSVPESPTLDDARRAIDMLLEVVSDFPFTTAAHRAGWLAALLTPLTRFMADAPAPMFLIDGNTAGCGKTMLVDCIGEILVGRRLPVMTNTPDVEEFRKRVTSLVLGGELLVTIDNIDGTFGNQALDALLTGARWLDRRLGVNDLIKERLSSTWYATGNNIAITGDLARRAVHIRLDTPEERPETRSKFRHPDLLCWVRANRTRLLEAALTVVRAYIVAGRPLTSVGVWGSYPHFTESVSAALVYAGQPDPGSTTKALREDADTKRDEVSCLMAAWHEIDPTGTGLTAAEACRKAKATLAPLLTDWFQTFCPRLDGRIDSGELGRRLARCAKRVIGCERFVAESAGGGTKRWRLVPVLPSEGGASGVSGVSLLSISENSPSSIHGVSASEHPTEPTHPTPDGTESGRQTADLAAPSDERKPRGGK